MLLLEPPHHITIALQGYFGAGTAVTRLSTRERWAAGRGEHVFLNLQNGAARARKLVPELEQPMLPAAAEGDMQTV